MSGTHAGVAATHRGNAYSYSQQAAGHRNNSEDYSQSSAQFRNLSEDYSQSSAQFRDNSEDAAQSSAQFKTTSSTSASQSGSSATLSGQYVTTASSAASKATTYIATASSAASVAQSYASAASSSFKKGTLIWMEQGAFQTIENVKTGERVRGIVFEKNRKYSNADMGITEIDNSTVIGTRSTLLEGGMLILNGNIHTTLTHQFWSFRNSEESSTIGWQWRDAWEVMEGDEVWTEQGKETINSIKFYSSSQPVYTIETNNGTFFADNYLVKG